jgi:hypothetical protein
VEVAAAHRRRERTQLSEQLGYLPLRQWIHWNYQAHWYSINYANSLLSVFSVKRKSSKELETEDLNKQQRRKRLLPQDNLAVTSKLM